MSRDWHRLGAAFAKIEATKLGGEDMANWNFARNLAFLGVLAFALSQSVPAYAGSGSVHIRIIKAGFILGGTGGSGTLRYGNRTYRLSIGGLRLGATFGASQADLRGTARGLRSARDIEGTYAAVEASAAGGGGIKIWRLRNQNGVELRLEGTQVGLEVSLDLGGMIIRLE